MLASGKMNPDLTAEYRAATEAVAVADLSARGRLRVTGADATRFLQGQFTNDISALKVGQGCYAALCNAKGKMRGDAVIYRLADSYLLDVEPLQSEPTKTSLERFIIADDVQVTDVGVDWGKEVQEGSLKLMQFAVIGPKAKELIYETCPEISLPKEKYSFVEYDGDFISRTLRATVESYDFIMRVSYHITYHTLMGGTSELLYDEAVETLRIEAGIPRYGVDMDENTIPIEAGIESRAISYTKGCYIGQEVIARIHSGGHVNRHLVGLKVGGNNVPSHGEIIFYDGKEVGSVTSACFSPKLNAPLALGYVRRDASAVGTKLVVGSSDAEIVALPLKS